MRICIGVDKAPGGISIGEQSPRISRSRRPINVNLLSDDEDEELRSITRKTTTTTRTVTETVTDDGSESMRYMDIKPMIIQSTRQPMVTMEPESRRRYMVEPGMYPVQPINITLSIGGFGGSQETAPEAPHFRRLLDDVAVREGGTIQIECIITGHPFPTITWFKDDQVIPDSKESQYLINGNRVSLVISHALPQDTGEYTCRAENPLGTSACTCRITISGK